MNTRGRAGKSATQEPARRHWSRRTILICTIVGALFAGGLAVAASNWVAGLGAGSSGEAQSGTVNNLTITAIATPAATNLLFPGGSGDVVVTISNPNPFPVTLTAVNLPTNATYAGGFSNSALTTAQAGCAAATPSGVVWNFSTGTSGSSHTLTTPLTIGATGNANNPLTVTLTNDALMALTAPSACQGTFFSMPALIGISATAGGTPVTTTPIADAWTS
jgi:hypothetical protein